MCVFVVKRLLNSSVSSEFRVGDWDDPGTWIHQFLVRNSDTVAHSPLRYFKVYIESLYVLRVLSFIPETLLYNKDQSI